jgi:hypothetical protein
MPSPVIPFRPLRHVLPSLPLPLPMGVAGAMVATEAAPPAIDLAGKSKCWFFIGRGRIGKTTHVRYVGETIGQRGASAIIAAADPVNRSLRAFLDDVAEPHSTDPKEVERWLIGLLQHIVDEKMNGLIDLGGGDTSLSGALLQMPDLVSIMTEGGVEPVAIHIVGTDPHDLTPLAMTEARGFAPRATAIIMNEAHGRRDGDFDHVMAHPAFRAAMDRGAVKLFMPCLTPDTARIIDANHWRYHDVKGKLGAFGTSSVQTWLRRMGEDMAPIASWIPE